MSKGQPPFALAYFSHFDMSKKKKYKVKQLCIKLPIISEVSLILFIENAPVDLEAPF